MNVSRWLVGLLASLMVPLAAAAVPAQMNVQGQLLNADGQPVDGTYTITFTLYDGQGEGASAVWTETIADVEAMGGLFDELLGAGTTPLVPSVFSDNAQLWLGITIEAGPGVADGGDPELPRKAISSVGYAFSAQHAVTADTANEAQHAVTADSATTATTATTAGSATTAGHAATADSATTALSADSATTALTADSATVAQSASSADISLDLDCTGCVQMGELDADFVASLVTQSDLSDALAGLTTIGSLGCTEENSSIRFNGADWECVVGGGSGPAEDCKGDWKVLQWESGAWNCVDVRATGLSGGEANQFEVVDPWGYAWDGQQRASKTWPEAKADCEADGGRLPTATELYRVSHAGHGTGAVGDPTDGDYLWAIVPAHNGNNYVRIRLSDGAVTTSASTSAVPYRCIWPKETREDFNGTYCFGEPGSECQQYGLAWNVDTRSRPPLDIVSAQHECRFYNARLLTIRETQEIIQDGWAINSTASEVNQWHRATDFLYWYNGGYGNAIYRWTTTPQDDWAFTHQEENFGERSTVNTHYRFRCIGKRDAGLGALPESPGCYQDSCYTLTRDGVQMIADNVDRPAVPYKDALETCRALGADLPASADIYSLIHSGWQNGTNNWLWVNEAVYWYNNAWGNWLFRWSGTGSERWYSDGNFIALSGATSSRNYRCIWRETIGAPGTFPACGATENLDWDGESFSCTAAVPGTSCDENGQNCKANPGGLSFKDAWGNAWDLFERSNVTYAEAQAQCQLLGARLPTATEIWRVRANQNLVDPIGQTTNTNWLWTLVPDHTAGRRIGIRVSDGATTDLVPTNAHHFRCIWPTTRGNQFGGRSCYGEVKDEGDNVVNSCFNANRLRMDKFDRPALPQSSASWECNYFGGRLPSFGEFAMLVHAGAPNGSNNWHWVSDPIYVYASNHGYHIVRWNGTGTNGWDYQHSGTGSWDHPSSHRYFRCVFTDRLD